MSTAVAKDDCPADGAGTAGLGFSATGGASSGAQAGALTWLRVSAISASLASDSQREIRHRSFESSAKACRASGRNSG